MAATSPSRGNANATTNADRKPSVIATSRRPLIVAIAIAVGVWLASIVAPYVFGKPRAARELVALVPNLLRLFRGLMKDPRVPRRAKVLLAVGVVWLASPIDLLPEFLPVIGPLDDAIVAAVVLRYLVSTPAEVWSRITGSDSPRHSTECFGSAVVPN